MKIVIQLKNVCKEFKVGDTNVLALNSIDLTINENDFIAVMGPSGSGKSTLLNILGCLDTPTSGEYLLDDVFVSKMNALQLAGIRNQKVGFVFQSFNLLPNYNALQNVILPLIYAGIPKQECFEMGVEALKRVNLYKRWQHKPSQLSGGERQRIAIARALINDPSIILADEPTGNLDSKSSKEIMHLIKDIHLAGKTILLVTHDENVASWANETMRMSDGLIDHFTRR